MFPVETEGLVPLLTFYPRFFNQICVSKLGVLMIRDKYLLMSAIIAFVILTSVLFADGGSASNGNLVLVHDVSKSSNGYVFTSEYSDGGSQRCFSRILPVEGSLCLLEGSVSEDGSMLFVSSLTMLLS